MHSQSASQTAPLQIDGLEISQISDIGLRRLSNQDSCTVQLAKNLPLWRKRGHLFIIADGMGAHASGELASKMAVENIPRFYHKETECSAPIALANAIQKTNRMMFEIGQTKPEHRGMGTTCSCLLLLPAGAALAHIGDSRVYRLRAGLFEQLTFDHSLVWEMAAASTAPDHAIPEGIPKNVITRSLGPHATVKIDLEGLFETKLGDRYLLCSDGLSGPVTDPEIGAILATHSVAEASEALVNLANLRGGPDNITAVIFEITDPQWVSPPRKNQENKQPENGEQSNDFKTHSNTILESDQNLTEKSQTTDKTTLEELPFSPRIRDCFKFGFLFLGLLSLTLAYLVSSGPSLVPMLIGSFFLLTASAVLNYLWRCSASSTCGCPPLAIEKQLGKGPYRQYPGQANAEVIASLMSTIQKLAPLKKEPHFRINWQLFDEACQMAEKNNNPRESIRTLTALTKHLITAIKSATPPESNSTISLN